MIFDLKVYNFLCRNMAMVQCLLILLCFCCRLRCESIINTTDGSTALDSSVTAATIRCPGECVNIFASFLCDRVLDGVDCGDSYSRCCISEDLRFGTEVVTSLPIPENIEGISSTSVLLLPSTTESPSTIYTDGTTAKYINVTTFNHVLNYAQCEGTCVQKEKAEYCKSIRYDTDCGKEEKLCCDDLVTTVPTLPICPGTCVSTLFSLLCDYVAYDYYCEDGGKCCLPPALITTTPSPPSPCPGSCIPTFLSGMCNRPSELIVKTTDCFDGTICCYNPHEQKEVTSYAPISSPPLKVKPLNKPDKSDLVPRHACPGTCINNLLRFTCVEHHTVYSRFNCSTPGTVCCVAIHEAQRFEQTFQKPALSFNATVPVHTTVVKAPALRIPNPYICGIKGTRRQARIVGGLDSKPDEWCWQVALINSQNQYICGGSLIGTQWVLTAAHCITNIVKNGDAIFVRVGESDLTQARRSSGSQTKRVLTHYIHHNHNRQTLDNDIALLKLQSPVELTRSVCLICLPARGVTRQAGKRCTVTGYGYKGEAGPIALKIREAQVPIIDEKICTVQINAVTEKLFVLPASSFCAGGEEGDDACQGDGGGPLACEVDGFYELTGIVSWGFGCGRTEVPGIYVKVSSFIGWINQIISVNNL